MGGHGVVLLGVLWQLCEIRMARFATFLWGFYQAWLQILGGNGFSCVYKDLERRERYTSCIGWVLFRKVCDVFYLAYVLPNLSTFVSYFCFLYMVWDW